MEYIMSEEEARLKRQAIEDGFCDDSSTLDDDINDTEHIEGPMYP